MARIPALEPRIGANASRVEGLIEDIDDASSPERTEQRVKKTAKAPVANNQAVKR